MVRYVFRKCVHTYKCAHLVDPNPHSLSKLRLHRISMPYDIDEDEENKEEYKKREDEEEDQCDGKPTVIFGGKNKEDGVVYMSFSKSTNYVLKLLKNMIGDEPSVPKDSMISKITSLGGAFFYLPAREEFYDEDSLSHLSSAVYNNDLLLPEFKMGPASNKYMFYNHKNYMARMYQQTSIKPPAHRVMTLMKSMFENWEDTWFHPRKAEPLPHLDEASDDKQIMSKHIHVRQAEAIYLTLSEHYTMSNWKNKEDLWNSYGVVHDLFRINPTDIIAGKMPLYGLGVGQIAMPYLKKDTDTELSEENIFAYSKKLSNASGYGHVIPNYKKIVDMGLPKFIRYLDNLHSRSNKDNKEFYYCCKRVFQGIQKYLQNYAHLASYLAADAYEHDVDYELVQNDRDNLNKMSERLYWLANGNGKEKDGKPRDFHEAVQLLFTLHACLHMTCEPVSVGRIDVILEEFCKLQGDNAHDPSAPSQQDIIDAFWIKLGEKVQLSRETRLDLYTVGTVAVPYRSDGRFPRGDSCNQWVQQITVGGCAYDSKNEKISRPSEKRKEIAKLCLNAACRLPLNAPCLSLRVDKDIDDDLLRHASKALLSGGAHPVILHDDRIIPALQTAGFHKSDAYGYSSDGCYEPIVPGKSEFSFCYVSLLQVLEMTINDGATIIEAGPAGMRGYTVSQKMGDINSFEDIWKQFGKHLRLQMNDMLSGLLSNYGNIYNVCASPMLSPLIDGCMESGKDLYNGGALIKMIACMTIGFANTVDSLYAIHELCFGYKSVTTLRFLLDTLKSDWGYDVQEPIQDPMDGESGFNTTSQHMKSLRKFALKLPKMGQRTEEDKYRKDMPNKDALGLVPKLKNIAERLSKICVEAFHDVTTSKKYPLSEIIEKTKDKYFPGHGDLQLVLGSGTFEGYVGWGLGAAASADGRRKGQPIASDLSPSPIPQDLPDLPKRQENVYDIMEYWDIPALNKHYPNGCEIDLNIDEDTDEEQLFEFLKNYSKAEPTPGKQRKKEEMLGGNILTLSCGNQETYRSAMTHPEQYDLIRVRTGGWTEFFVSFYTAHQLQHLRRVWADIEPPTSKTSNEVRKSLIGF